MGKYNQKMVLSRLREQKKEKTIYKMNHKWNYQPPSQEQTEAAKALAKETGISPILCKLLLERGITSLTSYTTHS